MKNKSSFTGVLTIIFIILYGCAKEEHQDYIVKITPVSELGKETVSFTESDTVFFEFSLTNQSGKDTRYVYPCGEYGQYLKIYKKDNQGAYQYVTQPEYNCQDIYITKSIKNDSTIILTKFPWIKELGCPELKAGKYYVGDTFTLGINNESYAFDKRIYFEIN